MNKILYIVFLIFNTLVLSQGAFLNRGYVQIHDGASLGFHTDLINNGEFVDSKGLVGFYSRNATRVISGSNRPVFYNVDIVTINDNLELQVSLGVTNILSFVEGKVLTPREEPRISLDLIGHEYYVGEDNDHYVDGYNSAIKYDKQFKFAIGDDNRLRLMFVPNTLAQYKGAYFFENPSIASTFTNGFNTETKATTVKSVSKNEFWDLDGQQETVVTLTWDQYSDISLLVVELEDLTVVGWHKDRKRWEDLGNSSLEGTLTEGKITSKIFKPNKYKVITFGCKGNVLDDYCDTTVNTFSPDNDGVNDTFQLKCADSYPEGSSFNIYDRWGTLVYVSKTVADKWNGFSNIKGSVNRDKGLATGVYFYVISFTEESGYKARRKGWIYLVR